MPPQKWGYMTFVAVLDLTTFLRWSEAHFRYIIHFLPPNQPQIGVYAARGKSLPQPASPLKLLHVPVIHLDNSIISSGVDLI